jgi:hypothetical protein
MLGETGLRVISFHFADSNPDRAQSQFSVVAGPRNHSLST